LAYLEYFLTIPMPSIYDTSCLWSLGVMLLVV
jgi:hypothetical protein